jgi:hypothetical protein
MTGPQTAAAPQDETQPRFGLPVTDTGWEEASDGPPRPGGTVHARRVLAVEQAFIDLPGGPAHGPSEIAEAIGLHITVVYRILQSGLTSV